MRLINLTPNRVVILTEGGVLDLEGISGGKPARVESVIESAGSVQIDGHEIPLGVVTERIIKGLPDPEVDTLYVVSGIVSMLSKRADAVCTTKLVRSKENQTLAARALLQGG